MACPLLLALRCWLLRYCRSPLTVVWLGRTIVSLFIWIQVFIQYWTRIQRLAAKYWIGFVSLELSRIFLRWRDAELDLLQIGARHHHFQSILSRYWVALVYSFTAANLAESEYRYLDVPMLVLITSPKYFSQSTIASSPKTQSAPTDLGSRWCHYWHTLSLVVWLSDSSCLYWIKCSLGTGQSSRTVGLAWRSRRWECRRVPCGASPWCPRLRSCWLVDL